MKVSEMSLWTPSVERGTKRVRGPLRKKHFKQIGISHETLLIRPKVLDMRLGTEAKGVGRDAFSLFIKREENSFLKTGD